MTQDLLHTAWIAAITYEDVKTTSDAVMRGH